MLDMEARFEKQEVMLEDRFQRQTEEVTAKVTAKVTAEVKSYVDKKIDEAVSEMTRQFNAGVEIIRDDFKGAHKDQISSLGDKASEHEAQITVLEQRVGLRG